MEIPNEVKEYHEICSRINSAMIVRDAKDPLQSNSIMTLSADYLIRRGELVEIIKDKYLNYLSLDEQHDISFY